MSASSAEQSDDHEMIHLGGETAVVVPLGEYRRLRVGAYRVLYEVENDVITILRVDKAL